ncbi:MAG: CBM9 family sugar-binding protein [Flavobacteriaceae bacterium]
MKLYKLSIFILCLACFSCKSEKPKAVTKEKKIAEKTNHQLRFVKKATEQIVIDGIANETTWQNATWYPMNQVWLGNSIDSSDFSGKYKLTWSKNELYVLVEIQDDVLRDVFSNPLERWWDEDCVEIFIDEDNSGGNHQFNHNAFAYHIDLKGNVVDIIAENTPKLFNDHVQSKVVVSGENTTTWEFKISLFSDAFEYGKTNETIILSKDKKIGFAIAYCDNDNSNHRENFIGSVVVEGNDKDRGWIDANIFGTIELKE